MKERLERLLDETIPNWRSMPREELLEMIFERMKEAEFDKRRTEKPPDDTGSER